MSLHMKKLFSYGILLAFSCLTLQAKEDAPRGFDPISEYKQVQTKAQTDKKLILLVVKGKDDTCPRCAAALENGLKAAGSGIEKVFARAETIEQADASNFSPALKERISKHFVGGAYVTFVVLSPDGTKILAEATRKELESDKEGIATFKKQVQEAKKSLK